MTARQIHPSAVVHPDASVGEGVTIGPFCIVDENVTLADGVELLAHVCVSGRTTVGPRTKIFPFASVGHPPQDLKYAGEPSTLEIGADCVIREHATLNPGTKGGGMATRVGDNCLLMIGSHIAHDCQVGNGVILSNNAGLAGHCVVDDFVIIGGHAGAHQYVRIGAHAFIGAMSYVNSDVIPYGTAVGNPAYLGGLNLVGLKRRGFEREALHALRAAYRMVFSNEGTLTERVADAEEIFEGETLVEDVLAFIKSNSDRRLCAPLNSEHEA